MSSSIHRSISLGKCSLNFVLSRTRDFSSGFIHVALRERLFSLENICSTNYKLNNTSLFTLSLCFFRC